jgi:uncharacterized protein
MEILGQKLSQLSGYISQLNRVVVAFSGGVDSSLLLKVALDSLKKENVLAVTVASPLLPSSDLKDAVALAEEIGVLHRVLGVDLLQVPEVAANSSDRCYYCKSCILKLLVELAHQEGYCAVLDGTNLSDTGDYRPGLAAVSSLEMVKSPLLECGLGKSEVRALARLQGLRNWNRPARPCLASRIPYGEPLSLSKLQMVARAEDKLAGLGITHARVRYHGALARIEVDPAEMQDLLNQESLQVISRELKSCGFTYVALDLDGYREGSLNEVLS